MPPAPCHVPGYRPRAATESVLYGVVQSELEPFVAAARAEQVARLWPEAPVRQWVLSPS